MQTDHNVDGSRNASRSRREFLCSAVVAAGSASIAATLPILPLTDEQQLEACIGQLRNILNRMHPKSTIHHPHFVQSRADGSYRLHIQSDVEFQPYDGPGLYEISLDGYILPFWLERDCRRSARTGEPVPGMHIYHAMQWDEDGPCDYLREFGSVNIVRKLEGGVS